jgi:hypothetical protein
MACVAATPSACGIIAVPPAAGEGGRMKVMTEVPSRTDWPGDNEVGPVKRRFWASKEPLEDPRSV